MFPCIGVKESVSGFFLSIDSIVKQNCKQNLSPNQIPTQ